MDDFLRTAPLGASPLGTVWVVTEDPASAQVLAYYCVAPDPVDLVDEAGSVVHGVVTVLRIERIATATVLQGQSLGHYLLAHIFEQVLEAAEVHPIDAVTLVPLNDRVRAWYGRLGFVALPNSHEMAIAMSTIRRAYS
jgi:GNAT superfamily N-acetyltransferase